MIMSRSDFRKTIEELMRLNDKTKNYNDEIKENLAYWFYDLVVETIFRSFKVFHTDQIYQYVNDCVEDGNISIDNLYDILIFNSERDREEYSDLND